MTDGVWIALIVALITGTLSPALLLWMTNRSKRQERLEIQAREDAREARAVEAQRLTLAGLETIKKQTDGVISQVSALAKSAGRLEGDAEATKAAQTTAATLALGQQQGRDAERESIESKTKVDSAQPLPVIDKITNETGERSAAALEDMAKTAQQVAGPKTAERK